MQPPVKFYGRSSLFLVPLPSSLYRIIELCFSITPNKRPLTLFLVSGFLSAFTRYSIGNLLQKHGIFVLFRAVNRVIASQLYVSDPRTPYCSHLLRHLCRCKEMQGNASLILGKTSVSCTTHRVFSCFFVLLAGLLHTPLAEMLSNWPDFLLELS